tara:strand:- start:30702 stop:31628 length:927 start_codon:yes stop_codon:yes gene_type:complete
MKKIFQSLINRFFKSYLQKKQFSDGHSNIIIHRKNYANLKNLNNIEYKVFSQSGEDGIIDFLLHNLKIIKPKFIEIGVGDYSESNTRFIYERCSPKGLIIDCVNELEKKVSKNIKMWTGDLKVIENYVDSKNILNILQENNFIDNIDLFSIDIDGIDYWILEKLPSNFSKIAIVEFNANFGEKLEITVPNIDNFNRTTYHYSNLCFGMSLKAAINIMEKKNYYFIGTNLMRTNAFFISKNYSKEEYFPEIEINKTSIVSDVNFRESRDKAGRLNFLSGKNKIEEIGECEVVDLSNQKKKITKIKDLLK